MNKWSNMLIGRAIEFNPKETLQKGSLAKKIPMGMLTEFRRKIKGFEFVNYVSGPKFRNGDVLLSKITPCLENGKTAQCDILDDDEVAYGSSEFIVLRETEDTISDFIFYLAISPTFRKRAISCMEGTSGRKRVNENTLKFFEIPFPQKAEQVKISRVLKSLDTKIELNNKINQELEVMAKTLYDYWFVQYDFPNEQGKPYKSSGGKMVYNDELKREIPEGWEAKAISEWVNNDKSGDWGKESEQGGYTQKVSCVRGADLNGLNGKGELKSPTRYILEKNSKKILEAHDLIIEISGGSPIQSTGRLAFVTDETLERFDNPLICSNFCKAVTLKKEKYLYNFVYQWNRLYDHGVLFGWEGKTSGIKNLLFESFVTNQMEVYPKLDVVEKFYEFAKPIHAKKQKNLLKNQKLTELRDWLLPLLMNGQVTVDELDVGLNMAAEPNSEYDNR